MNIIIGGSLEITDNDTVFYKNKPLIISGHNIQGGDAVFNKEKTKNIVFSKPFTTKPYIDLTLEDTISSPAYHINVSKNGFTIKTGVNYTGTIEWKAIQIN